MATVDEYLNFAMLRRPDVLTRVIERKKPQSELYDVPFAPLFPYNRSSVELMVKTGYGAGLAQFKADNGNTPIATFTGALQRQLIDLVTIAEKDVLGARELKMLQSTDPNVAQEAASSIVEKTMMLRHRNVNRTRWLAWEAAKGSITITYPTGSALTIDYDLDGGGLNSGFSATHLPTTSVSWADAAADIIGDVHTWAKRLADDLGGDEQNVAMHVSSTLWRYIRANTAIKAQLSSFQPRILTPQRDEVATILGIALVKEVNDFYWDGTTKNRFLPDANALFTYYEGGKYQYNGEPLMQMYDGPVVRVVNGDVVVENNPGLLAEMYVIEDVSALNIRVQSSRMPVMLQSPAFLYAAVVT